MSSRGRTDPGSGAGSPKYPGTFLLAFREAAESLEWKVKRFLGALVECVDAQGNSHMVGLENLFRRIRPEPRDQWPSLIVEFLKTAGTIHQAENLPAELATVADQLMVRLGTPLPNMPEDARVWSQPLSETGLVLNLVVDYDNRMCYVTEKLVRESGKPGDEWLEKAIANLRARTPEDCLKQIDSNSGMRLCALGDAYDSSRALLLETLLPDARTDGWFVALPGRDQFMVLPVSADGLSCVHLMKAVAERNHKVAPYPISNEIFWVHDGVWRLFAIRLKGQEASVRPPEEFVKILNRLLPEKGGDPGDTLID